MGAKAPTLYASLVKLVSHFSLVYFEFKNAVEIMWTIIFGFVSVTYPNGRYL